MITLDEFIRQVARSYQWQLKYELSKNYGLKMLFENVEDLSGLQLKFLRWLSIYKILYEDLANNAEKLNENVIKDDVRTDAYLIWRKRKNKQDALELRRNSRNPKRHKPMEEGLIFENLEE